MKNISYRSGCPVANVLDLMGDKWSLLVIRDIFMEKNTYTVFLEGPEKISTNILSHRLKLLQELDLIGF